MVDMTLMVKAAVLLPGWNISSGLRVLQRQNQLEIAGSIKQRGVL